MRIDPSGARTTIVSGLPFPTGMTMGPDGDLWVSNQGFDPTMPGFGQILRIDLTRPTTGRTAFLPSNGRRETAAPRPWIWRSSLVTTTRQVLTGVTNRDRRDPEFGASDDESCREHRFAPSNLAVLGASLASLAYRPQRQTYARANVTEIYGCWRLLSPE